MAKERYFTGFECGNEFELSLNSGDIIADSTARTGDFVARSWNPQGTGNRSHGRTLLNTYDALSNGNTVVMRMQVAFRLGMAAASRLQLFGFGNGTVLSPNQGAVVFLETSGFLTMEGTNMGTLVTNWAPALNKWYVGRIEYRYTRNDAGLDPFTAIIRIYDGDVNGISSLVTPLVSVTSTSSAAFGSFQLAGQPTLGPNSSAARLVDYDDWWYSVADGADSGTSDLNWPVGTRVQAVPITGAGSLAAWTGEYRLARDIPNSAVSGNEQTTTVAGNQTLFTHQTAAELGLIPIGQLASEEEVEESPPFSGAPVYDGLTSGARVYTEIAQDLTLLTPSINSWQLTAGAGQFNNGVWVRAFQIEWRSQPSGGMIAYAGPMTSPIFFSAAAAPNFAALIRVRFNPSTPVDRFLDPNNLNSGYRRYGLGVIVTNAYNDRGLLNPFTDQTGLPGSQTNTTDLKTYGGPGGIDAGPWGSLVALISTVTPNGTQPPYANTNPFNRPTEVQFNLSSPRPAGTAGTPTATNLFGPIFQGLSATASAELTIAEAIKVVCAFQRSAGSGNDDIMIGSTATSVATTTTFGGGTNSQFAIDWTARNAAAFDALQFGARAGAGLAVTLRLGECVAQVLTSGPCTKRTTGEGQYQHQCGTYVGDGAIQKIALAFKPTFIMIKRTLTTASPGAVKGWWCGGTQSWVINSLTPISSGIMLLEDDGFTLGPDNSVNGVGATYAYVAIKDGQEDTVNDAYVVTGSYYRQSSLDPDETVELLMAPLFSASWIPDIVLTFDNTTLKTPDIVAGSSDVFTTTGLSALGVTAIGDKTFNTGSTIAGAGQHFYVAVKFDTAGLLATVFQYGSFAGTGLAQTIPTNFQGELIVIDHPNASYNGRWRSFTAHSGTNSTPWIGGANTTVDITAIGPASFDVGTGASVAGQTSYWIAWKINGAFGNTGGSTILPPSDDDDGGQPPPGVTDPDLDDDDGTPYELESEADRALRLANLCTRVLHRLGDSQQVIWTEVEIDSYLRQAALQIAVMVRLIWDQNYLEDIPPGFNFTQEWERDDFGCPDGEVEFRYGVASCTYDWELELGDAFGIFESDDVRYASHTCPAELLHAVAIGASIVGEATLDVPVPLIEMERSAWDQRTMDALSPRDLMENDTRFEITQGEVFAYTWRKDGNRKYRKVRIPNQLADLVTTDGGYGIARRVDDPSESEAVTGTWGIPRRIRGWHPFGSTVGYGMPRRFYYDQLNVKIEFWRKFAVECRLSNLKDGVIQRFAGELPRRYFMYMADYCQWKALWLNGPGQDIKLGQLYKDRWERNLGRLADRVRRRDKERLVRLGGNDPSPRGRPPRPKLPWQYGSKVR